MFPQLLQVRPRASMTGLAVVRLLDLRAVPRSRLIAFHASRIFSPMSASDLSVRVWVCTAAVAVAARRLRLPAIAPEHVTQHLFEAVSLSIPRLLKLRYNSICQPHRMYQSISQGRVSK
jgi:hypothetical protein